MKLKPSNSLSEHSAIYRISPGTLIKFLPLLVLVSSLLVTWHAWDSGRRVYQADVQDYFDFRVREALLRTEQRMVAHEQVLRGVQGLFDASRQVSRDEFRDYFITQHLEDHFPGIQGVGFAQVITPDQKNQITAAIRKEGYPQFHIWPESQQDTHTSIIYLEPFAERNLRAFGYDMYSEPVRREAMARARDTGLAAMSGKVELVQETSEDVQAGFLIYLPIYRNGMPHTTIAERRANLAGWAYSPLRMRDLALGMYGEHSGDLNIEIYDGEQVTHEALMYDSNDRHEELGINPLTSVEHIEIAGNPWTLLIQAAPSLNTRIARESPRNIIYAGGTASLLIALLTWLLVSGRERALKTARQMNRELIASEERYRLLVETSPFCIHELDLRGRFLSMNQAGLEMRGLTNLNDILNLQFLDFVCSNDDGRIRELMHEAIDGFASHFEFTSTDDPPRHYKSCFIPIRDPVGTVQKLMGITEDVTDNKMAEEALKDSEQRYRFMFDNSPLPMWIFAEDSLRFLEVNDRAVEHYGYSREEFERMTLRDVRPLEDIPELDRTIVNSPHGIVSGEFRHMKKDGTVIDVSIRTSPMNYRNMRARLVLIQDITERKRATEQIKHMAHYDTLTDLPNRVLFSDRVQQALATARRDNSRIALMFVDLDRFKPINDELGHHVGDMLLKEVAKRMQDCMRESDTVARFGGDEFVVFLPVVEKTEDALRVAEKIRSEINRPFLISGNTLQISSSTGIAVYPEHGKTETELMKHADIAMYQSKQGGRNSVVMYQNGMVQED